MAAEFDDVDVKFIFNALRQASVIWGGRRDALKQSRRRVLEGRTKKGAAVYKYHYQCARCQKWFRDVRDMEVDHIKEIGGVGGFTGDWNLVMAKMFPRPVSRHLQVLCIPCHLKKTLAWNSASSLYKRKKK